ncbi:uncharacterized protein TNCV_3244051 [Trichonephila clavipes]|nr:uncharacterized protein TNCV_3244051 [Trichonephila clavipes]
MFQTPGTSLPRPISTYQQPIRLLALHQELLLPQETLTPMIWYGGSLRKPYAQRRFSNLVQSRHSEMMTRRKGLSPNEIANMLRELSENESDGGELSCSNLDSDEEIRLSESDCEESEESADEIDNIPIYPDIYGVRDNTE